MNQKEYHMNQVTVAGHLGSDPEVRFTPSGQKVTTFRLGARARKSNKDETIWWRITIWGDQFDKMMPYIKKGGALIVFGDLSKPETYQDKEGKTQVSLNITATNLVFSPFGKPDSAQNVSRDLEMTYSANVESAVGSGSMDASFSDDDVPF